MRGHNVAGVLVGVFLGKRTEVEETLEECPGQGQVGGDESRG